MPVNRTNYQNLKKELSGKNIVLVAVSKTKPVSAILELYELGHRDFGENYVQELVQKAALLPKDIRWHFIGHLQSNKVKYIAPLTHLIHSVDSLKLLKEINKQAQKNNQQVNCLLQLYIAQEETKFGLDEAELQNIFETLDEYPNVLVKGLMGMASFSNDLKKVKTEFQSLKQIFEKSKNLESNRYKPEILSMGMSGDYKIAIEEGSSLVRIGSILFGERNYATAHQ